MKSYIQLANIAHTYYDIWTSDGIDAFHADTDEITAWLNREDLRTDADTTLADLTDDEIKKIASMIADMVKDAQAEDDTYYILRDMDGYGSEYPICVDRAEAERLVREWDAANFDSIWRVATEEEIATYGRYDTEDE